jgi:hypothetical protein
MSTRGIAVLGFIASVFAAAPALADGSSAVDPAFAGCATDDDCVAVPQGGCCDNGYLVAVSWCSIDDYYVATECTNDAPICSQLYVNDTRVAYCDFPSHTCQMIQPTDIHCGGFINPNHQCPDGFQCKFSHVPDVGGSCVPVSSTK